MKTIFTIHAGEFLVGSEIERRIPEANVWLPSKDTGVDLLATNKQSTQVVSLQVKFSRDYRLTTTDQMYGDRLRATGWWKLNRQAIHKSEADLWVFVLLTFAPEYRAFTYKKTQFVLISPRDLEKRLSDFDENADIQFYLWVTSTDKCWATRGLRRDDLTGIADGSYSNNHRDFTQYLNAWSDLKGRLAQAAG